MTAVATLRTTFIETCRMGRTKAVPEARDGEFRLVRRSSLPMSIGNTFTPMVPRRQVLSRPCASMSKDSAMMAAARSPSTRQ